MGIKIHLEKSNHLVFVRQIRTSNKARQHCGGTSERYLTYLCNLFVKVSHQDACKQANSTNQELWMYIFPHPQCSHTCQYNQRGFLFSFLLSKYMCFTGDTSNKFAGELISRCSCQPLKSRPLHSNDAKAIISVLEMLIQSNLGFNWMELLTKPFPISS